MQDILGEGVHQMFGGPIFDGRNAILLLVKALKFRVIFQKYSLKIIKIWKTIETIRERCHTEVVYRKLISVYHKWGEEVNTEFYHVKSNGVEFWNFIWICDWQWKFQFLSLTAN